MRNKSTGQNSAATPAPFQQSPAFPATVLWLEIFKQLDPTSLARTIITCYALHRFASNTTIKTRLAESKLDTQLNHPVITLLTSPTPSTPVDLMLTPQILHTTQRESFHN